MREQYLFWDFSFPSLQRRDLLDPFISLQHEEIHLHSTNKVDLGRHLIYSIEFLKNSIYGLPEKSSKHTRKVMVVSRIVPWYHESELKELKEWFYDEECHRDKKIRAIQRVKSYQSRGSQYLPHVIDSTAQITNCMLLDEERSQYDKISVKLSYTMSLIRFVNGILDPTQQSQFAVPLYTLAKKTGLPSWFVDLRHWGTHERELPSLEMLRIAAKEALMWLWDHYWNDDELEEEEEEESGEENEKDEIAMSLHQLMQKGKSLENLLKEYHWYWEEGPINSISRSNFEAEEEPSHLKRRKKLSPQALIEDFIADCKDAWGQKDNRTRFIEIFMQKYTSTLLGVLVVKLPGFDRDLLNWILQNFKEQLVSPSNGILRQKFNTIESLERKLLSKFVSSINLSAFIGAWASVWEPLMSNNATLVSYKFCQLMASRLAHERDNVNKKKKRRVLSSREVGDSLSQYIDKYSHFAEKAVQYGLRETRMELPEKPKAVAENDVVDILKDIETLRKKHTTTSRRNQWDIHPDWSPRPFGTL